MEEFSYRIKRRQPRSSLRTIVGALILLALLAAYIFYPRSGADESSLSEAPAMLMTPDGKMPAAEGSVAYHNDSGCVVVWMAPTNGAMAGDFRHCDDVSNVAAITQREVAADIGYTEIRLDWDAVYAPCNWQQCQ